ncbi:MAG TPA: potassium/proton antiporter [Chromatiaceae bacterium]|nr:potassium/proton antiporter [Chromatiaceae bacterium]
MDLTNEIILIAAMAFLVSILASLVGQRLGMPVLLVFLIIGMLLGEEGPGDIHFDDVQVTHLVGSLALAIILFDGGMATSAQSFRVGLQPALGLATLGVLITSALTGLFATQLLGLSLLEGLLLAAIVGSTDAAAVFSLLRSRGLELKERVKATLEIESGSNDPMAIFLTLVLMELILSPQDNLGTTLALAFVQQMGLGAVIGVVGGYASVWLINHLDLPPGLHPIAVLSMGLSLFGLAAILDGSGFLAIYLAGLVIGNRPLKGRRHIGRFHDGLARLAQIGMFLVLGLLVTPSELLPVALDALLFAALLSFVARPLAVWICLLPFGFPWREQVFIGWVGLRGSVPIVLALFPLLAGMEQAHVYFNIVFFVVLVSLVGQGWTIPLLARWLGLELPPRTQKVERLEIDLPGERELELVGYELAASSPLVAARRPFPRLPPSARPVAQLRQRELLDQIDWQDLRAGDQLLLIIDPAEREALDRLLAPAETPDRLSEQAFFGEFVLNGEARLGDVAAAYGLAVRDPEQDLTLDAFLRHRLDTQVVVGDRLDLQHVQLVVRRTDGNRVLKVGLKLTKPRGRTAAA